MIADYQLMSDALTQARRRGWIAEERIEHKRGVIRKPKAIFCTVHDGQVQLSTAKRDVARIAYDEQADSWRWKVGGADNG